MNILFLTLAKIRKTGQGDIYSELMEEFAEHGHEVYVVSPVERKERHRLRPKDEGHLHFRFADIGNYFNTPWMEKGITTVFLSRQYISAIKKELNHIDFDLLLYSTPPVTFSGVIRYIKDRYPNCISYLMLKDIWPQAMVDMGTLNNKGVYRIPYAYFRHQERKMYQLSDYIGCMSPANEQYLYNHNRYLDRTRIELCPNAVKINENDGKRLNKNEVKAVRERNNLPVDKTILVFGGNIGNGHDPDFIIECLKENEKKTDSYILFVGKGFYYERLNKGFEENEFKNAKIAPYLPQDEYLNLIKACDVGLIFLDHRFTIPNFPSKLVSYLRLRMPVLISSDTSSDIGLIAEKAGFGYWCESNDSKTFGKLIDEFKEAENRHKMGDNGFEFLNKHYNTEIVYKRIMKHFSQEAELRNE